MTTATLSRAQAAHERLTRALAEELRHLDHAIEQRALLRELGITVALAHARVSGHLDGLLDLAASTGRELATLPVAEGSDRPGG